MPAISPGLLGTAAVLATVALIVALAIREARVLGVRRDTLHIPELPSALDGVTLAFLADIHAGPWFGPARVAALVERVNELEADVVLLGGDYVGGRHGGAAAFYPEAANLSAKRGVYAVLGNHDEWEGIDVARNGMAVGGDHPAGERLGAHPLR